MLETTGALMRNIVQGPSTVDFLRLEVRDCDLTFGFWNQPGTRVMSDYLRSWTSMEAERAISAVHKYHSTASLSSATVLAGSRRDSLEGIDLSLSGASRLSGSMAATSIALNLSDDTRVDADMLDADSVLVTAFGNSRVHVKKVKATRMLLIADSSSLIEVETASCDLVLVRQHKAARVRISAAAADSAAENEAFFALTGDRLAINLPADAHLIPQEVVDQYWLSLLRQTPEKAA